jgi:hypothetical protein
MPPEREFLTSQAVSPQNCVLAFGVPTDQNDFAASLANSGREYAKHYLGGWPQYERNFVSQVVSHCQIYTQLGVRVVFGLTSSGLKRLFEQGSVISLFTHWTAEGIELCDGILSIPLLVEAIPPDFSGVLDLCICHPDDLVKVILRDRPRCSVRYVGYRSVDPLFWLEFYSGLYQILLSQPGQTYSAALIEFTLKLRQETRGEGIMESYKRTIENYVRKLGQLGARPMGEAPEITQVDKAALTSQLQRQYRQNQILIWVASILWVLLFFLAGYFALHYRDNLTGLTVALGRNLMVLGGVMIALRRLWLDSSCIGALLAILPGLSPDEAAKAITGFYLNALAKKPAD